MAWKDPDSRVGSTRWAIRKRARRSAASSDPVRCARVLNSASSSASAWAVTASCRVRKRVVNSWESTSNCSSSLIMTRARSSSLCRSATMEGPLARDARAAGWTISSSMTSCSASSCRATRKACCRSFPCAPITWKKTVLICSCCDFRASTTPSTPRDRLLNMLAPVVRCPQPSPPGAGCHPAGAAKRNEEVRPEPDDLAWCSRCAGPHPQQPAADRQDHDPAAGELALQPGGNGVGLCGDEDAVVRRLLRPAQQARDRLLHPGPWHAGGGDVVPAPPHQ